MHWPSCDQSFATALDGHTDTYEEDDDTFICLPFADDEHKMGDNLENNNMSDVTKKTVQGALHRMIMDEEEEPAAVERVRIELNSLKHCLGKSDLNGAKDAGCVVILSSFEAVAKFTSCALHRMIMVPVKTQTGKKKLGDEPKLRPSCSTEQIQLALEFRKNSIICYIKKWRRDGKLFLQDWKTRQSTPQLMISS